jgi:hypothetical protein
MNTLQMALIGYQAERRKIEEKIAEIRAQLNGRSWRSRQASSSFSRADHGVPRANLDPDIATLSISRQSRSNGNAMADVRSAVSSATRTPRCSVLDAAQSTGSRSESGSAA